MLLDLRGLNCSLPGRSATGRSNAPILADIDILPHETGDTLECLDAANGLFFYMPYQAWKSMEQFFRLWPANAAGSRRR